jgi:hypothetical protein
MRTVLIVCSALAVGAADASAARYVAKDGRLRNGAISDRARLTILDLDYVGPSDDSYLCDTGARRYRASR